MHEKKYEEAKKEIRSVLLTFQNGVLLDEFLKTYQGLLGERLPSRACGFPSDIAFLQSMPDAVEIHTNEQGRMHLTGVADRASQHIQKLVSKQRPKSKQKGSNSNKRQPARKLPDTSYNVKKQPAGKLPDTSYNVKKDMTPFLPGPLRAEILQLMASFKTGISLPGFAIAYRRKFDKYLPLAKGLDTLEGLIKQIPDLELRVEGKDKKIYPAGSLISNGNKENDRAERNNNLLEENLLNIHISGIPEEVLEEFKLILQKCSDGILSIHFPVLYENLTGKEFDLHSLGYNSLAELVDALPHIFKRTEDPTNAKQWIILPADASAKKLRSILSSQAENSPGLVHKNLALNLKKIPADVSSPSLQFSEPNLPKDLNLDEYVPVFISAILDPSQFWFQLQTDEAVKKFEELEKDMENFYNWSGDKYKMKDVDMTVGATCVIQCPDDDQWYRAVIKSIPSIDHVNVYFADYGSRQNVPRKNVYYVRSKYHDFPAYAFKAELACLKPSNDESLWSIPAQRRFIELCNNAVIMAYIIPSDEETYSIYLCDTSGETDIHVNDTLIEEGFAKLCLQNQLVKNNNLPHEDDVTCKHNEGVVDSGCYSSLSDLSMSQSDSEACSRPDILTAKRKLSFSAKESSDDRPDCSDIGSQATKRYVKVVELWPNTVMHVINVENRLFMPSGELCRHLWNGKTSNILIQRLLYKGVEIPFLKVKEEDNAELFKQCRWCKIPDMEELDLNNSNLILCPLEEAIKVLEIFGYPFVGLSVVIEKEIENFDPFDLIWTKFDYEETFEWDDNETDFLQEMKTLCGYDLKVKHEALRVKRLLLLRNNSFADEEVKRIDKLLHIVEKRLKQIEEICSQYSK